MWENNQEMLQKYCDNNDQTNMTLVTMVILTAPNNYVLHHKFDNKVHTVVDHRWVHKTNIENVCDQDSD